MPKPKKVEGTNSITVTGVPIPLIRKLTDLARNKMGVSRNSFLKTEFFKIIEREESKNK